MPLESDIHAMLRIMEFMLAYEKRITIEEARVEIAQRAYAKLNKSQRTEFKKTQPEIDVHGFSAIR
jgi:hypothetical protein